MLFLQEIDQTRYTDFSDLSTSGKFDTTLLEAYAELEDYYNGVLANLPTGIPNTNETGLYFIEWQAVLKCNYFFTSTEFYVDAETGKVPTIEPSLDSFGDVWSIVIQADRNYNIGGRLILVNEGGEIRTHSAKNYVPITDLYDPDRITGHCLVYMYSSDPNDQASRLDRIRITKVPVPGIVSNVSSPVTETYEWDGTTIGALVESIPADIRAIYVYGGGYFKDSFYPEAAPIILNLMIREAITDRVLNKYSNPILVTGEKLGFTDETGASRLAQISKQGVVEVINPEGKAESTQFLEWDAHMAENYERRLQLLNNLTMVTGVTLQGYGLDQGKGESGISKERSMLSTINRINRVRSAIEIGLQTVTQSNVTVTFDSGPLQSPEEVREQALEEFTAGIITREEVRERLGHPATPLVGSFEPEEGNIDVA